MQNKLSLQKFQILSGSALKLIAVITMLIDHTALVLSSVFPFLRVPLLGESVTLYFILRKIGRLAFPIYCFLIGEGFLHTRSKKRYALRLLVFAFLSELPFNLMLSGQLFYPAAQNVFFTLFLGVVMLCIFESSGNTPKKAALMLAVFLAAHILQADYGIAGVALILLICILRQHRAAQAALAYPLLSGGVAALCAFLPINMYNGIRGFIKSKPLQYCFYLFYPAHMLLLALVRYLLTVG